MDIIAAYQELGSYRAAADLCGTTHKTVKRVMDKFAAEQAGEPPGTRIGYVRVSTVAQTLDQQQTALESAWHFGVHRCDVYCGFSCVLGHTAVGI